LLQPLLFVVSDQIRVMDREEVTCSPNFGPG